MGLDFLLVVVLCNAGMLGRGTGEPGLVQLYSHWERHAFVLIYKSSAREIFIVCPVATSP